MQQQRTPREEEVEEMRPLPPLQKFATGRLYKCSKNYRLEGHMEALCGSYSRNGYVIAVGCCSGDIEVGSPCRPKRGGG